jgi:hypothetical protein
VGKTALAQIFRSDGAHFQKNYTLVSWNRGSSPSRDLHEVTIHPEGGALQNSWNMP